MLVNDANGKHLVAPGVLYVIQKYVYKKHIMARNQVTNSLYDGHFPDTWNRL